MTYVPSALRGTLVIKDMGCYSKIMSLITYLLTVLSFSQQNVKHYIISEFKYFAVEILELLLFYDLPSMTENQVHDKIL